MIALAIAIFGVSAEKVSAASEDNQFVKVEVMEMSQPITHYFEKYDKVSEKSGYLRTYLRHIRPSEKIAQTAYANAVAMSQELMKRWPIREVGDEPQCYTQITLPFSDRAATTVCIEAETFDLLKLDWESVDKMVTPEIEVCIWRPSAKTYNNSCAQKNPQTEIFTAYPFTIKEVRGFNSYSIELELSDSDFLRGKWYFSSSSYSRYKDESTYSSNHRRPMNYSSTNIGIGRTIGSQTLYSSESYTVSGQGVDGDPIYYYLNIERKAPGYNPGKG